MPTHPPTDPPNAIALSLILTHISSDPRLLTTRASQTAFLEKLTRVHNFPYRSPYWGNTFHDAKSLRTVLGNVMRKYGLPGTIEEEEGTGKLEGVERFFRYGSEVLEEGFVEAVRSAAGSVEGEDVETGSGEEEEEEEEEDQGGGSEAEELKALLEKDDSEDEEYQPRKGRMREAKRKAVVKIQGRRKRKREEEDSEDESGSESEIEVECDSEMDADGEDEHDSDSASNASNASTSDSPPPTKRRMSRHSPTARRVSTIARSRHLKREELRAHMLSNREQESVSESDADMDADGADEAHPNDPSTASSSDDDLPSAQSCVQRQRQTAGLSPTVRFRNLGRKESSNLLECGSHEFDRDVGSGSDADAEGEDEQFECRYGRSASIASSSDDIVVASRRRGVQKKGLESTTSMASTVSTAPICRRSMSDEPRADDAHVEESVEVEHDGYGEDNRAESDGEMDAEGEEEEIEEEKEREDERQVAEDVHFCSTPNAYLVDTSMEPCDLAERQETPIMLPPLVGDEAWDVLTTALNEVHYESDGAENGVESEKDADGEDEQHEEVGTYAISIASSSDEEGPSPRRPAQRRRVDSVLHASSEEEAVSIERRAKRSKSRSVSTQREVKRQKCTRVSNASSDEEDDDDVPLRGRTLHRQNTSSTRSSHSQVTSPRQRTTSPSSSTASIPATSPPTTVSTSSTHPTTRDDDPNHPALEVANPLPAASHQQAGSTATKAQTIIDLEPEQDPDQAPVLDSVDHSTLNPRRCDAAIELTAYGQGPSPAAAAAGLVASVAKQGPPLTPPAEKSHTRQSPPKLPPGHHHHLTTQLTTQLAIAGKGRDSSRAENPVPITSKDSSHSRVGTRVISKGDQGGGKRGGGAGQGRGGLDHAKFRRAVERMNEGINRAVVGLWEDMMMSSSQGEEGREEEGQEEEEEEGGVVVL